MEGEGDSTYTMILDRNIRLVKDHDKELMSLLPPVDFASMSGLIGNGRSNPGRDGVDLEI